MSLRYNIFLYYGGIIVDESVSYDYDILNEVIMVVNMDWEGKVGCVYYSVVDEMLFFEDDIVMGGIEIVEIFFFYLELILVFIFNCVVDLLV